MRVLRFTGPFSGRSVRLNGVGFRDGIARLDIPDKEFEGIRRYFGRCYQAVEVIGDGDRYVSWDGKEGALADLDSGVPARDAKPAERKAPQGARHGEPEAGDAGVPADRDRSQGASGPLNLEKVRAAVESLDPNDNDHWTMAGLPRVDSVAAILGVEDLSRTDMDRAAPDYDREEAFRRKAR